MSAFSSQTTSTELGSWQHQHPTAVIGSTLSTCGLRLNNEAVKLMWVFVSAPASANRTSALVANRLTQEVRTVSRVSGAPADPYDTINSTTSYTER